LGYSSLLGALAPTPGARQALLAKFFEPSDSDLEQGLKVPSTAHKELAQLVKDGFVRVILTTNFDRLIERALDDAGASTQVISRPDAVDGMTPLDHARSTLIKLHGDYTDLGMRNTLDELSEYPAKWDDLLERIFSNYGLLVCGWSADWDRALVAAIERSPTRRYPLYWDSRSSKGSSAQELLAARSGIGVPASSADELFVQLRERILAPVGSR
jgi:SIR2-like domain